MGFRSHHHGGKLHFFQHRLSGIGLNGAAEALAGGSRNVGGVTLGPGGARVLRAGGLELVQTAQGAFLGTTRNAERFLASLTVLENSCFVAGTPLLTPEGEKPIEQFRVGNRIFARSEHDPVGPVAVQVVEQTFVRVAPIMNLRVGGRDIRTTGEHPFYVRDKGWINATYIRIGDQLSSHDGQWVTVETVTDLKEVATVYNLRVSDYHTYFVGSREWGFSIWAHNSCYEIRRLANGQYGLFEIATNSHVTIDGVRVVRNSPQLVLEAASQARGFNTSAISRLVSMEGLTAAEQQAVANARAAFSNSDVFTRVTRFDNKLVIQRADIEWSVQNVRRLRDGNSPFVRNARGEWESIEMHHVGRNNNGPMIEVVASHNQYNPGNGGPLHIAGPGSVDPFPTQSYWRSRLQQARESGVIPDSVLREAGLLP